MIKYVIFKAVLNDIDKHAAARCEDLSEITTAK